MSTKCHFSAFCWAITRMQWYISMLSITSFIFTPLIVGLWHKFKLYTLHITGMCDICALSNEVKEVDVSRMLVWPLVWFLSSTLFSPIFIIIAILSLCFFFPVISIFSYFFIPFYSDEPLHRDNLCRSSEIDGFSIARYSGKWSEVNNVAVSR